MFKQAFHILLAILLLLLLALPIAAQAEEVPPPDDGVNVTVVVIGAFITVGITALSVAWAAARNGSNVVSAARSGAEAAVRGIITSEPIAEWGESGLSHIPLPLRNALVAIVDVFDPLTSRTESDLDEKTQEWIRNILDGDLSTGAVKLDE